MVLHEVKPGWTITREWEGYTIQADVAFSEVAPEDYVGIFFSGGRAPEYLRYDKDLVRITRHFFDVNKPVASVCHGVEIPAYAGCVKGRRMATVPKCRFDLVVSGRTYHDHGHYIGPWVAMLLATTGNLSPAGA
jgi:protease I